MPAAYIVYVDGEEFVRGPEIDDGKAVSTFETAKKEVFAQDQAKHGSNRRHEFALCVYKPRYGGYLRERLQDTAF